MGRLWHRLSPAIGLLLFAAALWVLTREIRHLSWHGLSGAIRAMPAQALLAALGFTVFNYAILTGYDQLAFLYIRRRMPKWQIAVASFVGYAIANNVGFALLSGTSARYRFYSRWGLSGQEISRVVVFYSGTFWLGLIVLGAWSLLFSPISGMSWFATSALTRTAGICLLLIAVAYALSPIYWTRPVRLGGAEIPMPSKGLIGAQFILSALDWWLAAAVLYVLVPEPRPDFTYFLGAFLGAQIIALVSHVPGGIGVFESLMILLLKPWLEADEFLPALATYRVIYYLLPLVVAMAVLLVDEFQQRRHQVVQWGNAFGTLTASVAPKLLAVFTLLAGAVLMFSGATPGETERIAWLSRIVPLPVLEISHFVASLVGFGLLVVSWGLARRLDAAYYLAVAGLLVGMGASLLKGGDYEEALILGGLLLLFVPSHAEFDRKAALFEIPFSPAWLTAICAVVIASVFLGLFAFRHVEYTGDLWWRFEAEQDAPRFLRATVGVLVAMLFIGLRQLLRPARPPLALPDDDELRAAATVVAGSERTDANLVFLRDKALLWNDDRSSFLMYGIQGRTWIALGNPIGPRDRAEPLVKRFLERVDDYQGVPVFYEATRNWLHRYADFGLTFAKLGEAARVSLGDFSLDGGGMHKTLRSTLRRVEKEGCEFRVIEHVDPSGPLLEELRAVSNEWLADKAVSEKGFSLGFFDVEYLSRFPIAVMARGARVEAFANLWFGANRMELSIDLMRYRARAPKGTMDALLASLMAWGHERGYHWFALGMAPLSGLEESPVEPMWSRLGRFVYGHGETFYNFKGLRTYKEKFHPVWEPRYLAYPGGLALPRILADVSALIAGGYRRLLRGGPAAHQHEEHEGHEGHESPVQR
jgi:phosphatidylglycerol lysyltransferase